MGQPSVEHPLTHSPLVAGRLLRVLSSMSIVTETGEDKWKPTPFSLALGDKATNVPQSVTVG